MYSYFDKPHWSGGLWATYNWDREVKMQVKDLIHDPKNPRKITDKKLENLAKSQDAFGDIGGIWFNVTTGTLGGGHQRSKNLPQEAEITYTRKLDEPTKKGTVAEGFIEVEGTTFFWQKSKASRFYPTEIRCV